MDQQILRPERTGNADDAPFDGSKAAVFLGDRLLVLLRDNKPGIDWPGAWDLVGGGRDPGETPVQTLAREMEEEVGLDLSAGRIVWTRRFPALSDPARHMWFYVVRFPEVAVADLLFGDEGEGWMLVPPERFLALPDAVPSLVARLSAWMDEDRADAAPG